MPDSANKEHWREHLVGLGVLKQADETADFFSSGNQIQATIKIRARHNFQLILIRISATSVEQYIAIIFKRLCPTLI